MLNDPVIEEVHRNRAELFQEFNNDPQAFVAFLIEQQKMDAAKWQVLSEEGPNGALQRTADTARLRRVCRR